MYEEGRKAGERTGLDAAISERASAIGIEASLYILQAGK